MTSLAILYGDLLGHIHVRSAVAATHAYVLRHQRELDAATQAAAAAAAEPYP